MSQPVKHHPEPQRGEPMADGCRLDRGLLLVGIVSTGELKVTSEDEEQEIILKERGRGDGAKSMYKLESICTLYKRVYKY